MKTKFARQKSEYSYCLINYLNCLSPFKKIKYSRRMREIQQEIKDLGDEIQIVITTKNTSNKYVAPAMTEEDIKKNKA